MENGNKDTQLTSPKVSQPTQELTPPAAEESEQDIPQKDKKIPKVAIYILASIILLVLGAVGFWFYQKQMTEEPKPTPLPTVAPTTAPDITVDMSKRCQLKPDPGTCKAYMPRYYFDESEGSCKEFIWGGCEGMVPFETLESCIEACEKEKNSKAVDFRLCQENNGYQEYVGFGSTYLTIKKDLGNTCEIEISNEVEGGYAVYNCNIPKSIGRMSIAINMYGSDFSPILQYCKEIKSGNVLMELQD